MLTFHFSFNTLIGSYFKAFKEEIPPIINAREKIIELINPRALKYAFKEKYFNDDDKA